MNGKRDWIGRCVVTSTGDLLIHLYTLDLPVGVRKVRRVGNLISACAFVRARLGERIVRPSTTKGDIKDNPLVLDHITNLTRIRASHESTWRTPVGGDWLVSSDIRGDVRPTESPNFSTGR